MSVIRVVPNLRVEDVAATRDLYVDLLGFEVVMDMGWIVTLCADNTPATQISIIGQDATAPVHPDVSIEVDDVDAAHADAVAAGLEIPHPLTDEPWGVRRFFFRDHNGQVINVLSHRE